MSIAVEQSDPFIVLYGISWQTYEKILEALDRYHLRHTYDSGTFELRALLYGVEWSDYIKFLEALGDHSVRHTYDGGDFEMMSPRKDHDWLKRFIGRIIETVAYEFDIDIQSIGSTTLTSEAVEKGFQPDETYYVAHESDVRGKTTFDPAVDPPPDLLLEVDVTNSSVRRLPSFAAMEIPEVWRHANGEIHFLRRNKDAEYDPIDRSDAFPMLTTDDVGRSLDRLGTMAENAVLRELISELKTREQQQ